MQFSRVHVVVLGIFAVLSLQIFLRPTFQPPSFVSSSSIPCPPINSNTTSTTASNAANNLIMNLPVTLPTRIGLRLFSEPEVKLGWLLEPYEEIFETAFRDQRVIFIGDSTLRSPVCWLQIMLFHTVDGDSSCSSENDVWSNMTLEEANNRVKELATKCFTPAIDLISKNSPEYPNASMTNSSNHPSKRTHIEWFGFGGNPSGPKMEALLEQAWDNTANVHPDVLVVNMGLHWIHRVGAEGPHSHVPAAQNMYRWIHYEDWLQDAIDRARALDTVRLLLFKTTNRRCTQANQPISPYDSFRTSTEKLQETLQMCESEVALQLAAAAYDKNNETTVFATVSKEQIAWYCRHGTATPYGTAYLNERLYRFVEKQLSLDEHEERVSSNNSTMKIGIFNDHDIEMCEYTRDNRHFHDLNIPRLWVLANLIVSP